MREGQLNLNQKKIVQEQNNVEDKAHLSNILWEVQRLKRREDWEKASEANKKVVLRKELNFQISQK